MFRRVNVRFGTCNTTVLSTKTDLNNCWFQKLKFIYFGGIGLIVKCVVPRNTGLVVFCHYRDACLTHALWRKKTKKKKKNRVCATLDYHFNKLLLTAIIFNVMRYCRCALFLCLLRFTVYRHKWVCLWHIPWHSNWTQCAQARHTWKNVVPLFESPQIWEVAFEKYTY